MGKDTLGVNMVEKGDTESSEWNRGVPPRSRGGGVGCAEVVASSPSCCCCADDSTGEFLVGGDI